jgi:hypothetical protein
VMFQRRLHTRGFFLNLFVFVPWFFFILFPWLAAGGAI